jgi:hypothetical protein
MGCDKLALTKFSISQKKKQTFFFSLQDLLFYRGFFWGGDNAGKGKARKNKKGKK